MTFARSSVIRQTTLVVVQLGLIFLLGCAKQPPALVGGAVTIELALPLTVIQPLTPGVTTTLTATIYDPSNQGVTWTVNPLNFGTLSSQTTNQPGNSQTAASVTYTVPQNLATNTTVTITATSVSNPNVSASMPIRVAPVSVSLQVFSNYLSNDVQAAYAQTLGPGQQLTVAGFLLPTTVTPGLTWSISPADAGTLTNQVANQITYNAPAATSSPLTATVTATSSVYPNAIASMRITVLPSGGGPNVAAVTVDGGPVPGQFYPNAAFTSVTICNPGSYTNGNEPCQNVNGVLVDTGSSGLRILQSAIPLLTLPTLSDGNGNTLYNCASQVDGSFLWGPVSQADVYIAGDYAAPSIIQVISSSNLVTPDGCSNGGTQLNTAQLLGANGILGIGPEPTDCTLAGVNYCDASTNSPIPNLYYACPSVGCATSNQPVTVPSGLVTAGTGVLKYGYQVTNPAATFSNTNSLSGNNSEISPVLQFPAVSGTEPTVVGTLTLVSPLALPSMLGSATVFDLDANDHFTTLFNGQTLTDAFLDTGANALYFPDNLAVCSANTQFFCPPSIVNLSAVNQGNSQGQSTINFTVDNADALLSANPGIAAFSSLAGPAGSSNTCANGSTSCVFDWGLPFFFGRTVYESIDCPSTTHDCFPVQKAWVAY